ncbi:unnamed protein product [Timema podura]|uniref:Sodium-coupled monocarboxylate transporter 2 n=1 Tax=Timema podura TaxID=61482 RepID=A0ABN7NJF7_TIMPD|nr:unnamed protein product [Timema podura]
MPALVVFSSTAEDGEIEGGIKAVVWTDLLQSFVTVGSIIAVIVIGILDVGGFSTVWERSEEGERLELFNMNPSPLARNTFWTVTFGMTIGSLSSLGINQGMVQKFITLPDYKSARTSLIIFTFGMMVVKTIVVIVGLIIYAAYYDCDPYTTKKISKPDQIVPYYVMDTAANIPGLSGLFVAGIFSAALSTMSSNLNCLAGTVYEDFILPFIKGNKKLEGQAHVIMKLIVVAFGLLCIGMVFVVEKMGSVYQLSVSLGGVTVGVFLGLFTLGMFFPWANSKGALAGTITGLLFMGWIVIGAENTEATGTKRFPYLPFSTEGCDNPNATNIYTSTENINFPMEEDNQHFDEPFIHLSDLIPPVQRRGSLRRPNNRATGELGERFHGPSAGGQQTHRAFHEEVREARDKGAYQTRVERTSQRCAETKPYLLITPF